MKYEKTYVRKYWKLSELFLRSSKQNTKVNQKTKKNHMTWLSFKYNARIVAFYNVHYNLYVPGNYFFHNCSVITDNVTFIVNLNQSNLCTTCIWTQFFKASHLHLQYVVEETTRMKIWF